MKYNNVKKAEFVIRRNRFICEIMIDGKKEDCHVKNTGRLAELLIPGTEIYVEVSTKAERKTKYDLVTVVKDGKYINIDSFAPNLAVGEYLQSLYPKAKIIPEKKFGNSRFDFYVESDSEKGFVEVKGVTLFRDGKALFPDAPTERGIKHLAELSECVKQGFFAKVFFVICSDNDNVTFSPNRAVGDSFADALIKASGSGVEVCAFNCRAGADFMTVKSRIKTDLA